MNAEKKLPMQKVDIIGLSLDCLDYNSAMVKSLELAAIPKASAVSAANTHIAAASRWSEHFNFVMQQFDLILPDGMPLKWAINAKLKKEGIPLINDRVYGPYFMKYVIEHAPSNIRHFFFGGSEKCLDSLRAELIKLRPDIQIAGMYSPPYRTWYENDLDQFAELIQSTDADFVWVALGGEKQERWIADNLFRYQKGVFFAVGDAFELIAGRRKIAPIFLQKLGLTWLYRLCQEPKRMLKRYLKYNSLFILSYLWDSLHLNLNPMQADLSSTKNRANVLGVGVSVTSLEEATQTLLDACTSEENGYVCVTGVHGVIESQKDDKLREIHNQSFLTVPDGMPTVWMGLEQGFSSMKRVYGPDLMLALFKATSDLGKFNNLTHFFYGATEEICNRLRKNLLCKFPGANIVGTFAPPFRALNEQEEEALIALVDEVQPDFFWVGLSTPKQEKFMHAYQDKLACKIMLGVGAAFPIHAGIQKDAPNWIKSSGFHWFYRLCQEPRRLWKRYLSIVPTFIFLSFMQLLGLKKYHLIQHDDEHRSVMSELV